MAAKKGKNKKSSPRGKVAPRKAIGKKTQPRKPVRSASKASRVKPAKAAPAKPSKAARAQRAKASIAKPAKKAATARAKASSAPRAQRKAAASQRPRSQRARSTSNGVHRRDRAGHLDPRYAAELHARSIEGHDASRDEPAFVSGSRTGDDLAEELGEEAVETMTSGENENADPREEFVDEEIGGPFVESPAKTEFAEDTDESNPADATREPFPKT
jgi:hypothetical protein